jgi:homoserine kinase type II
VSYDDVIRTALHAHWHLAATQIVALPAGLMSRAWAIRTGEEDLVVRLVDDAARQPLEAGLGAAVHLHARGIAIGQPVRTLGGALTAETVAGTLAVLRRVPGRSLHPDDPVDQQWWGDRLGAAHRELTGFGRRGPHRWSWLHPEAPHLGVEGWLRPAVADAMTAMTRLTVTDRLTYGVLHGDPAAEGFVVDPASGRAGLLDWGACGTGPLLYDVAAAVVYAGGPETAAELLDGYLAAGPVGRDEADAALPVLLRFRWAVQADWYARRLAAARCAADGDGASDPAPLRVPLQAARAALEAMAG